MDLPTKTRKGKRPTHPPTSPGAQGRPSVSPEETAAVNSSTYPPKVTHPPTHPPTHPDSQGICFLGKLRFDEFLKHYLGEQPGDVVW